MAEIPENTLTQADMVKWYELAQELKRIRNAEILLRKKIFNHFFPDPSEGTNNQDLDGGYVLKGKHAIERKIDEGAFDAMKEKFREEGINPDTMVQYKPSLVLKEYRKLTKEEQALFDQVLIIKPGSPALEIVLPKRKG